jgi:hypothetical protein
VRATGTRPRRSTTTAFKEKAHACAARPAVGSHRPGTQLKTRRPNSLTHAHTHTRCLEVHRTLKRGAEPVHLCLHLCDATSQRVHLCGVGSLEAVAAPDVGDLVHAVALELVVAELQHALLVVRLRAADLVEAWSTAMHAPHTGTRERRGSTSPPRTTATASAAAVPSTDSSGVTGTVRRGSCGGGGSRTEAERRRDTGTTSPQARQTNRRALRRTAEGFGGSVDASMRYNTWGVQWHAASAARRTVVVQLPNKAREV